MGSEASGEAKEELCWLSIDPLAEEFPEWSPYVFVMNNPLRLIDPDGKAPQDVVYDPPVKGSSLFNTHSITNGVNWMDSDGSWTYNSKNSTWVGFAESKGNNISAVNSIQEGNLGVQASFRIGGLSVSFGEEVAVGEASNGLNIASRVSGNFSLDVRKFLSADAWKDSKLDLKASAGVKVSNKPTLKSGFKTETSTFAKVDATILGTGGEIKVSKPTSGKNVTSYSAGIKVGAKPSVGINPTGGVEKKSTGTSLATDRNDGGY